MENKKYIRKVLPFTDRHFTLVFDNLGRSIFIGNEHNIRCDIIIKRNVLYKNNGINIIKGEYFREDDKNIYIFCNPLEGFYGVDYIDFSFVDFDCFDDLKVMLKNKMEKSEIFKDKEDDVDKYIIDGIIDDLIKESYSHKYYASVKELINKSKAFNGDFSFIGELDKREKYISMCNNFYLLFGFSFIFSVIFAIIGANNGEDIGMVNYILACLMSLVSLVSLVSFFIARKCKNLHCKMFGLKN